ncbi:putative 2-amino-4-hydroxy-6-hydroxymethyldihydropteridine diphosphokinase [Mycobacterium xenopi 3993]|nr:putative 2-amino-4-hydroxy-6-hydroxymethyldihydropteridine diphosphokinase [Mycobacterium xenopi 3993]
MMVPWLAIDPDAELTVAGKKRPVARLLAELEPAIVAVCDGRIWCSDPGVGMLMGPTRKRDLTAR